MASLGELFIELGVLGDDEGAKKVAKSIDEVIDKAAKAAKELNKQKKSTDEVDHSSDSAAKKVATAATEIGALITAVTGAVIALDKLTQSLVNQNQYWINLTRNSDIALGTFQKWGQVGAALDASLGEQGAAGAVDALNKKLFALRLTGEGARGFQLAGIMPTNAEDVLEQLRNRVRGMNDTSATYLLEQMGIDPRMLSVLRMTRAEFEALNAEMAKYRLTPEQRRDIQKFHEQMSIVNVKMQYFKDRIILKIMPYFLNFMRNVSFITEGLFKLAKSINKVTGNFKPLILIALGFIAKAKPIAKFLLTTNVALKGLITKIPIVGKLIAGLGGIIGRAFLPLTGLYLLLDDFRAYATGGGSMLGVLAYYLEELENKINFETPEWIKNLLYIISKLPNLVEGVQAVKDVAEGKKVNVKAGELISAPIRLLNPSLALADMIGRGVSNMITNNNNQDQSKNVTQNNYITTNQTQNAVLNELAYANSLM